MCVRSALLLLGPPLLKSGFLFALGPPLLNSGCFFALGPPLLNSGFFLRSWSLAGIKYRISLMPFHILHTIHTRYCVFFAHVCECLHGGLESLRFACPCRRRSVIDVICRYTGRQPNEVAQRQRQAKGS